MKNHGILVLFVLSIMLLNAACSPQTATVTPSQAAVTQVPAEPTLVSKSPESMTTEPVEAGGQTIPEVNQSFTVSDALGREITFDKIPERIVLVGKALFMVADAIYLFPEAGQRIVALGSASQGSAEFLPVIDPNFKDKIHLESEVGPEQIAAVQPDCVILKSSNAEKLGTPLEILGIPVVYLDFETPEQYQRDLMTLGQLFNNPERAKFLDDYYQSKFAQIKSVTSSLAETDKPKTLILYYSDKDGAVAFNVPPLSWMQTIQVEAAGGYPVWKDANLTQGWSKVTLEQIAAWNPEYIFVVSYAKPAVDVVDILKADPQWQQLEAVKNNKLYPFASDVYSWDQPDTRWILGLTWLSGILHPDLFPELDIIGQTQEFYQDLYGIDQATFQEQLEPMLRVGMN